MPQNKRTRGARTKGADTPESGGERTPRNLELLDPELGETPDEEQEDAMEADAMDAAEQDNENDADLKEAADTFALLTPKKTTSTGDALNLYLNEIGRFPLLKPEEEVELARRVRDHGDQEAALRLITSHLRLVVKIAMDFQRRWMQNVLDLIQEGNVGLMRATQKFDPEKGIKFSYYAAFWIKAYILKYIMDNWRMVKIGTTQTQRKLFYNLNKERQRLQTLGFDPTVSTLSVNLGVTAEEIREMDQRLSKGDMSLDVTLGEDSTTTRMDFLPALGPGVEETLAEDEISGLLAKHLKTIRPKLNEKELEILDKRLLSDSPVTLREIGEQYGITRERVRQIEARLLQKIREHLSDKITDFSKDWIRGHG